MHPRGTKAHPERLLLVLLLLALGGCDVLGFGKEDFGERRDLVERINELRRTARACGSLSFEAAPPVKWNEQLADAAVRHAEDLAAHGLGGHIGSDGSGPEQRIREAGYKASATGEIVAVGSDDADEVMDGWLESPGHCAALMNATFQEAGAAMAADRYWTVTFASE